MIEINTELPSVDNVSRLRTGERVINFSEPFNLEDMLVHTKNFIEEVFGETFIYRQLDKTYINQSFSRAYLFDNGKDRVDSQIPPQHHDGARLVLHVGDNRKKCSLRFSYIRKEPLEYISEWSEENPFDIGYETYGRGYHLIPFEVYVSTFTDGILALKNFYQSIIDNPSEWPGNGKRRGVIWGVEDRLKGKLEDIAGTKDISQIDDVAKIGSSVTIELEWWLLQETYCAYATGLQGAKYERRPNHDLALARAIEFSGDSNAGSKINDFLSQINQIGKIERLMQ